MKINLNTFTVIGILIYVLTTITDRFIIKINNYIYITILLIAMTLLIIGIIKNKKTD